MNEISAKRLLKKARLLALRYDVPKHMLEEIAQETLLKILSGYAPRQHFNAKVIDSIRFVIGDSRTAESFAFRTNDHSYLVDRLPNPITLRSMARYLYSLTPMDRAIAVLYSKWGLELKEIGYCFGISESAISQRLTLIKKTIKQDLKRESILETE